VLVSGNGPVLVTGAQAVVEVGSSSLILANLGYEVAGVTGPGHSGFLKSSGQPVVARRRVKRNRSSAVEAGLGRLHDAVGGEMLARGIGQMNTAVGRMLLVLRAREGCCPRSPFCCGVTELGSDYTSAAYEKRCVHKQRSWEIPALSAGRYGCASKRF